MKREELPSMKNTIIGLLICLIALVVIVASSQVKAKVNPVADSIVLDTQCANGRMGKGKCPSGHAAVPRTITKNDLVYVGAFRVPQGTYNSTSFAGDTYVNAQYQPLTFNPVNNSLFLGQKPSTESGIKRIGEISIPALKKASDIGFDVNQLNIATVLQAPTDISNGDFDKLRTEGAIPSAEARAQLGGLYVYNNKLYGTAWSYYDASATNGVRSHWSANLNWTNATGFSGLHTVGTSPTGISANGGFVGGYMVEVPDEYKTSIGFPLLTGRTGGPITSRSSYGPSLWGFDPATFSGDNPASAQFLIGYPDNHQTLGGYNDSPSLTFNRGTSNRGVIWPEGSDSILVFGNTGLGIDYDETGFPTNNTASACNGAGTSNRDEAKTNAWLVANSPSGYTCGFLQLSASDISGGSECCFDPVNPTMGSHFNPFNVGVGESCYGFGTPTHTESRTNAWLLANSPSGYNCNGVNLSSTDISNGNGCCFVGTGETSKGGSAYPSVHQVWQYSVNDLLSVKSGSKQPWEIIPTVWNFDLPFDNPAKGKQIIGVSYDKTTRRLYVGQAFGDGNFPLIHVFTVGI